MVACTKIKILCKSEKVKENNIWIEYVLKHHIFFISNLSSYLGLQVRMCIQHSDEK